MNQVLLIDPLFWQQFDFEVKKVVGLVTIPAGAVGIYREDGDCFVFPETKGCANNGIWNESKLCWQYPVRNVTPIIPKWFFKPGRIWDNKEIRFLIK